jgi:DNA polymerase-3 subunit gamma/tau
MLVKRLSKTKGNSLNTVYRPCTVDEILGNEKNKKLLKNYLDNNNLPRTLLFSGEAGCGKTTAARIIALGVNCEEVDTATSTPCMRCRSCLSIVEGSNLDVQEINVGKDSGKADMAGIVKNLPSSPFNSRNKVLIFDEAHELTTAAKDLLLKEIEDGYAHVYFIFCTNQPDELKSKKKKGGDAFLGRCSKMRFEALSVDEIKDMLVNVSQFEGEDYKENVLNYIADETKGVPRDALVILNDVINEGSWAMDSVKSFLGVLLDEEDPQIIELSRAIMRGRFKDACSIYEKLAKTYQAETVRIVIGAYFVSCMKRAKSKPEGRKFSSVLDILTVPIYMVGKPGEQVFYNYLFKAVEIINGDRR